MYQQQIVQEDDLTSDSGSASPAQTTGDIDGSTSSPSIPREANGPGGIDFNAKNMNVKVRGEGVEIPIADSEEQRIADSEEQRIADSGERIGNTEELNAKSSTLNANSPELYTLNADDIQGFSPVIIQVVPITDFYGLLGLKEDDIQKVSLATTH